jgi:hypothetical protein
MIHSRVELMMMKTTEPTLFLLTPSLVWGGCETLPIKKKFINILNKKIVKDNLKNSVKYNSKSQFKYN